MSSSNPKGVKSVPQYSVSAPHASYYAIAINYIEIKKNQDFVCLRLIAKTDCIQLKQRIHENEIEVIENKDHDQNHASPHRFCIFKELILLPI